MGYSSWKDSFFHTSALTGADNINDSKLFVHPRKGDSKTFEYKELLSCPLDRFWVSEQFPDVPDQYLNQLLFFIDAFRIDMRDNIYRYQGWKNPQLGARNERSASYDSDGKLVLEWGRSENCRNKN